MSTTTESRLLVHPVDINGEYTRVTPLSAGWEHLSFAARRMPRGQVWSDQTGDCEYGLVVLGGTCAIESSHGTWDTVGRRQNVFCGMPYALYGFWPVSFKTNFTSARPALARISLMAVAHKLV